MLNEEQFHNKWDEIRGGLRNLWGRLTDDELNQTNGNMNAITGLVEAKYDETKETIKKKLELLMSSFDNETDKGNIEAESSYQRSPEEQPTADDDQSDRIARH